MRQMSENQLAFFQALNAPFGKDDLYTTSKGGRSLTYVKAPTLMNRLDDVAGPAGWDVEYRPTERGFTCRLGILVPVGDDVAAINSGTSVWHYKEDGGGFEGMTKKVGSESVADEDNDEKSGYTNAFRRACYAWGMGRDLWRCGIPAYLGREPVVPDVPPPPFTPRQTAPGPNNPRQYPANASPKAAPRPQQQQQNGNYDNFKVPSVVKGFYPWILHQETHFGGGPKAFSNAYAKEQGYPFKSVEWDMDTMTDVAWATIDEVKNYQNYAGEYDHLEDPRLGG